MKGKAIIKLTRLGYEDHGILTCWLILEDEAKETGQGFGGKILDKHNEKTGEREPMLRSGFWIQRILETVGVANWEDLPGKSVRVDGESSGAIFGIGHITEDKWFYPKKEIG